MHLQNGVRRLEDSFDLIDAMSAATSQAKWKRLEGMKTFEEMAKVCASDMLPAFAANVIRACQQCNSVVSYS